MGPRRPAPEARAAQLAPVATDHHGRVQTPVHGDVRAERLALRRARMGANRFERICQKFFPSSFVCSSFARESQRRAGWISRRGRRISRGGALAAGIPSPTGSRARTRTSSVFWSATTASSSNALVSAERLEPESALCGMFTGGLDMVFVPRVLTGSLWRAVRRSRRGDGGARRGWLGRSARRGGGGRGRQTAARSRAFAVPRRARPSSNPDVLAARRVRKRSRFGWMGWRSRATHFRRTPLGLASTRARFGSRGSRARASVVRVRAGAQGWRWRGVARGLV